MKKVLCIVAGLLCGLLPVLSQSDCFFTHYSSEDGLSQNTVMGILQDRKGNMWFSTWDGINKFDGYTFKIYKADSGNRIGLSNNRIDHLCEDEFGFFWMKTYDDRVFRFDPRMEIFERIPLAGNAEGKRAWAVESMKCAARAARNMGIDVVTGFTGSSIWHMLYSFPPVSEEMKNAILNHPAICFAGWQEDIRPYLAASDIFVFPSYREGFPNVVLQAGAMGLPCIVTDINGCNEIIQNGVNGLIIPPHDELALYNAMEHLMVDVSEREWMAQQARFVIVKRYEQRDLWQALLNTYREQENAR